MYIWSPFPFVRFSIALITGILLSSHYEVSIDTISSGVFLLALLMVMILFIWLSRRWIHPFWEVAYGLIALMAFIASGWVVGGLSKDNRKPTHYASHENVEAYQAKVVSDFSDRKNYHRYEVEIVGIYLDDSLRSATGRLFLYIRKQDGLPILHYGDLLQVYGAYYPVQPPGNPHEFNYKAYLKTLNIYSHSFVDWSDIERVGSDPPSRFLAVANDIRSGCKQAIYEVIKEPREQSILLALLVGIKDYLDEETRSAYSQAGAMHVLAVSGLHVGIVYYLLNLMFGFLKRNLAGKLSFIAITILIIWMYAGVTGFSPSVLRASVMFSVILISQTLSRRANIYNSLGIAALVLLLYDPQLVYAVGFQLSFAAVLGIVFLQPKLYGCWQPKWKLVDYLWSITCVSIAAQLATFPLTVYYFHQFPTYFLVSNLIVIPAAAAILTGGIITVGIFQIIPVLGQGLGWLLSWLMYGVNELMDLLTMLPLPVVDWLYFDFFDTALVYAIILLASISFDYQLKRGLIFTLLLVGGLFVRANLSYFHQQQARHIVFYEIKDHIAIDFIDGRESTLLVGEVSEEEMEVVGYQVNPNRLASGLKPMAQSFDRLDDDPNTHKLPVGYVIQKMGQRILIVDAEESLDIQDTIQVDVVYLNRPVNDILNQVNARAYILGSDIGYYAVRRLRNQMTDTTRFLHSLKYDGAYMLPLEGPNVSELVP